MVVDAAPMMADLKVGALPIVGEDARLQGILTDRDIVGNVALRAPGCGHCDRAFECVRAYSAEMDARPGDDPHQVVVFDQRRLPVDGGTQGRRRLRYAATSASFQKASRRSGGRLRRATFLLPGTYEAVPGLPALSKVLAIQHAMSPNCVRRMAATTVFIVSSRNGKASYGIRTALRPCRNHCV
ncbi:CBS domain-containing protein [Nocardia tengchongensis]|uniref:CBS domain-containing protein n=1 Tax=Nocardia tengchongensis TaxID=2055889 RepID=UPI00364D087D